MGNQPITNFGGTLNRKRISVILLFLVIFGSGTGLYFYAHRFDMPELPMPDVNAERYAAVIDDWKGSVQLRNAVPEDFAQAPAQIPAVSTNPSATPFQTLSARTQIHLGTYLKLGEKSSVHIQTEGRLLLTLEGPGEFILEDARTNYGHDSHTSIWVAKYGRFLIKVLEGDPQGKYFFLIRTPKANLMAWRGEMGLEVNTEGKGRMWKTEGEIWAFWFDGRKKALNYRGLEYL